MSSTSTFACHLAKTLKIDVTWDSFNENLITYHPGDTRAMSQTPDRDPDYQGILCTRRRPKFRSNQQSLQVRDKISRSR